MNVLSEVQYVNTVCDAVLDKHCSLTVRHSIEHPHSQNYRLFVFVFQKLEVRTIFLWG